MPIYLVMDYGGNNHDSGIGPSIALQMTESSNCHTIMEMDALTMRRLPILIALLINVLLVALAWADSSDIHIEKRILEYIKSDDFRTFQADQRCGGTELYQIYLIDNFELNFNIVSEVQTSHGEMLLKLLHSGRDDIEVTLLNTSLSKGLAQTIDDLNDGICIDAVISSIPGSNYTYDQVSSLFTDKVQLSQQNILFYRGALRDLVRNIAFHGFPSVEWLEQVDVNPAKLRNDARKFVFLEALGKFNIPVILPYGNSDTMHKGKIKSVNLLSLATNAKVFSALDQEGKHVPGFPYSPLSSGNEPAVYNIIECPDYVDPFRANLDINNDNYIEYTFIRTGKIAYYDDFGGLLFAPPVLSQTKFTELLAQLKFGNNCRIDAEIVLTAAQYRQVKSICPDYDICRPFKSYVWLNSSRHGRLYDFEPQCWNRGLIVGTSVIPPNKVKELLPP
jgi:hypothetical protein